MCFGTLIENHPTLYSEFDQIWEQTKRLCDTTAFPSHISGVLVR